MIKNKVEVLQLSSYIRPEVKETTSKEWVLYGDKNGFYETIIDGYNNSPTNSAILDSYSLMAYGLGLNIEQNIVSKNDLRNAVKDFIIFNECAFEVAYVKGKVSAMYHIPKQKVAPEKQVDGEIKGYYFCENWSDVTKNVPVRFDAFGFGNKKNNEIVVFKDYQVGKFYYSDPAYLSALPYIQLEQELSNYYINHVKNGLSAGFVINMNGGQPESEEQKDQIARTIKHQLTGSQNAGKFVLSFNDNKDTATTIEAIEISDAHSQYQFLTEEAQNKICVSHKVVSRAILGINDASGFSSNAEEISTAFNETMLNVIQPKQEVILDGLEKVTGLTGLQFIPLRQSQSTEAQSGQNNIAMQMSKHKHETDGIADALIELGEEIDAEEWEEIDALPLNGMPQDIEMRLNLSMHIEMARDFASFWEDKSKQDTSLFKVRYRYQGGFKAEREFCQKMVSANKVYRKEDIDKASSWTGGLSVNRGFGANGADNYDLFFFKGGVNCKHYWERVIFLKKDNEKISVNEARKMILQLDPEERAAAKWENNDPRVAQIASEQNNFWRLK